MGLSFSYKLFETFSTAMQWIAENKLGVAGCCHIDDFFLFVSPNYKRTLADLTY